MVVRAPELQLKWVIANGVSALALTAMAIILYTSLEEKSLEVNKIDVKLSMALQELIAFDNQLISQLETIVELEKLSNPDVFGPELWLSSLKQSVAKFDDVIDFKARAINAQRDYLARHKGYRLVRVPLEIEIELVGYQNLVAIMEAVEESMGSYSAVEHCRLITERLAPQGGGSSIRCRLSKISLLQAKDDD